MTHIFERVPRMFELAPRICEPLLRMFELVPRTCEPLLRMCELIGTVMSFVVRLKRDRPVGVVCVWLRRGRHCKTWVPGLRRG
jgi:hypothetical protein